jgi:hypothetical protein
MAVTPGSSRCKAVAGGQGNGAGPIPWAVVSTPVLKVMRAEGFGTFFKACISGESIRFVGYSFVDDTDLTIQTAKTPQDTKQEVADEMQCALNMWWEGAIRATGWGGHCTPQELLVPTWLSVDRGMLEIQGS